MDQKQSSLKTIHPMDKHHYLMMARLLMILSKQKANRRFIILLYEKLKIKNGMIHCVMVLK